MTETFKTENFLIEYKPVNYKNNIILELYRQKYYEKLKDKLNKIRIKYLTKLKNKKPDININDIHLYLSQELSYDLLSIFIMDMDNKKDPIFNDISPFTKQNLHRFFNIDKCIATININIIKSILRIYPYLSKIYIKYFNKLKKKINTNYKITHTLNQNDVKITLDTSQNDLIIPNHIFYHLVKNYNIKKHNIFENDKLIIDNDVITCIYILFIRYITLSNGNNQASILPSFKKLIKEKLNIKVELFGSPLNTSLTTFGSYFYDTDNMFGSIGNFFNMNIKKGYYEINPPFDRCIINKIFNYCLEFLLTSEKDNEPLLFLFIIPYTYFKNKSSMNVSIFEKFLQFDTLLDKNNFPYIRYSRDFKKTIVKPIVSTRIFICATSHISTYTQINLNLFDNTLKNWIKKK
jgi:hypothetical protein